jgi:protein TonB
VQGLQRFIIASTIFHLVLFSGLMLAVAPKKPKSEEAPIIARLITPTEPEAEKKIIIPKIPLREIPLKRQSPVKIKPVPKNLPYKMKEIPQTRPYIPPKRETAPPGETTRTAPQETAKGGPPGRDKTITKNDVPIKEMFKGPLPGAGTGASKSKPGPTLNEKLFDKGVIEDLIAKNERSGPRVPSPKDVITFSTKEMRYLSYMQRLKEKIEGIWVYPREMAEKGIYGDLYIRFAIKHDGSLGEVVLERTSGHQELDDAAMKALKDAEPFWPLPASWKEDTFVVEGHFVYTLEGVLIK